MKMANNTKLDYEQLKEILVTIYELSPDPTFYDSLLDDVEGIIREEGYLAALSFFAGFLLTLDDVITKEIAAAIENDISNG
jgi:hypothetical protein